MKLGGLSWRRAAAELAVVVLGILIALAADDWYAGLEERGQEAAWVRGVRDDLLTDQAFLNGQLGYLEESAEVIRSLIESIDDPHAPVQDTLSYLRQLKRATNTYFFRPTATTYEELTASGSASAVVDRRLMRAVIEYQQAALLTEDLNEIVQQVKWFDYNDALADALEPTLLAAMTEDWYRLEDQWPPGGVSSSPLEAVGSVDLSRLRSSPSLRNALARSLDLTVVQRGDMYRMLQECERVLALAEEEVSRLQ